MSTGDATFTSAGSSADTTFPRQGSEVQKGHYLMIDDQPCRVVSVDTVQMGKHGHSKLTIRAEDVFTGEARETVCPATCFLQVPFVTKTEYNVITVEGDKISLMEDSGDVMDRVPMPGGDLGQDIRQKYEAGDDLIVTVIKVMGREAILSFRAEPKQ